MTVQSMFVIVPLKILQTYKDAANNSYARLPGYLSKNVLYRVSSHLDFEIAFKIALLSEFCKYIHTGIPEVYVTFFTFPVFHSATMRLFLVSIHNPQGPLR